MGKKVEEETGYRGKMLPLSVALTRLLKEYNLEHLSASQTINDTRVSTSVYKGDDDE